MVSRERFDSSRQALLQTMERSLRRLSREQEARSAVNPGVEYAKLVSQAELAEGVWYRQGETPEFVLVVTNHTKEIFNKANSADLDLQRKLPLVPFKVDLRFSALSAEDEADLTEKGYKWVSGVENDVSQPPQNP